MNTYNIKFCTSCKHWLPEETFIYKNKFYKTCSVCLTEKAEKKALALNGELESMDNQIENQFDNKMETITFIEIIEYVSNKLLVKLIVDEIKESDGYSWTQGDARGTVEVRGEFNQQGTDIALKAASSPNEKN
ncbi:10336_t:CDS:2, partial [Gigaspora rosea]